MILTAHQPNLMPWWPFFEKMSHADAFVFLENVQFEKNNFQNRFQLNDKWFTMSVKSGMGTIREKEYVNPEADWDTIKRKLPAHARTLSRFDDLISHRLCEMNGAIIERIARMANISTERLSDFETDKKGTDRLVELCAKFGATTYLSGPSGRRYLDLAKFQEREISVEFYEPELDSKIHTLERLAACL